MIFDKLNRKAKFYYLLAWAKIVADITMIIGFVIILFFVGRQLLF